jgi:hypothetical protein
MNGVYMLNPGCYGPGLDIGGQVNAAYTLCPLSGCVIQIPAGTYAFSTPIAFGTVNSQKALILRCGGGTNGIPPNNGVVQLVYTGTGAAISFNDGGVGAAGMQGCTLIGPSKSGTSVGLTCGSNPGGVCIGHVFDNNAITGFGVGIQLGGQYSYLNTFLNDDIADNGINVNLTNSAGQTPGNEENRFIGGLISNQSTPVLTTASNCIETANATSPFDLSFIGVSLDQCNVNLTGAGQRFRFIDSHFEINLQFPSIAPFINIASSCSTCNVQLVGTDIIEDAPGGSTRSGFIVNNDNTPGSPAAVIIEGGRFFGGTESNIPIINDTTKTNLASVQNAYKGGAVASDINAGAGFSTLEWGILSLGESVAGTTYTYPSHFTEEVRDTAGCTTGTSAGADCTTGTGAVTIVWPVPFPDAHYSATCTGRGINNQPGPIFIVSKGTTQMVFNYQTETNAGAGFTNVDCIAVHD